MKPSPLSPRVLVSGIVIDPPGSTYGPRTPKHYEFIWIMEGEAKASFGPSTLSAKEGTILFRGPGVRDHYQWSERRRTVHAYVQFQLAGKPDFLLKKDVPAAQTMPPNDVLRPLFGYLLQLEDGPGGASRDALAAQVLELMLRAYCSGRFAQKQRPLSRLPPLVDRACEVILAAIGEGRPGALRLSDLAREVHVSSAHLCRLFQKNLGFGPLEYAKMARLDRAANLLRQTQQSLKQIASATGFYDSFHLSRSFKRVYGVSPKGFRATRNSEWLTQKNPIFRVHYKRTNPRWAVPDRDASDPSA